MGRLNRRPRKLPPGCRVRGSDGVSVLRRPFRVMLHPQKMADLAQKVSSNPAAVRVAGDLGKTDHWCANFAGRCEEPRILQCYSGVELVPQVVLDCPLGMAPSNWAKEGVRSANGRYCGPPMKVVQRFCARTVDMAVRCRKCSNCRKFRAKEWTNRALKEAEVGGRTWFCTYTSRPSEVYRYKAGDLAEEPDYAGLSAEERDAKKREWLVARAAAVAAFQAQPWEVRFEKLCRAMGADFSKMLKRLRWHGALFRYFISFEAHKSGLPHMHVLFHEVSSLAGERLSERVLKADWRKRHGIAHAVVVPSDDDRQIRYAAKYVAKGPLMRVRASFQYGKPLLAMQKRLGVLRGDKPRIGSVPVTAVFRPDRVRVNIPVVDFRELDADAWLACELARDLGVWRPPDLPVVVDDPPEWVAEVDGASESGLPGDVSWEGQRIAFWRDEGSASPPLMAVLPD